MTFLNCGMPGRTMLAPSLADVDADPDVARLSDLAAEWSEIDPLITRSYARRKQRLGAKMLALEAAARAFRQIKSETLYRAFDLRGRMRGQLYGDGLLITPRKCDLLSGWTADEQYAFEHASQFEDAIVIECASSRLDIFLNLAALSAAVEGLESLEGEVLVRSAPLLVAADMVLELGD